MLEKIKAFFKPTPEQKLERMRKRVTNIYSQKEDRQFALYQARDLKNEDGVNLLIARFTVMIQNSTVDIDEKQLTSDLIAGLGPMAVEPLKLFLRKHDKDFNWPFKTLQQLIPESELIAFMTELLQNIGTDYVRDPERKEQLLLATKKYSDIELSKAAVPYLRDDNETIRFVASDAVLGHAYDFGLKAISDAVLEEDSQRVITHIFNGFKQLGKPMVGSYERLKEVVPSGFVLTQDLMVK